MTTTEQTTIRYTASVLVHDAADIVPVAKDLVGTDVLLRLPLDRDGIHSISLADTPDRLLQLLQACERAIEAAIER
jgi:hypothetical protein